MPHYTYMIKNEAKFHTSLEHNLDELAFDNNLLQTLTQFFGLLIEADIEQRKGEKDA